MGRFGAKLAIAEEYWGLVEEISDENVGFSRIDEETADFEKITADPAAAISRRRALTVTLRPKFAEVGQLLKKMD